MFDQNKLQQTERELLSLPYNNLTEIKILEFWREYEPKRVEDLLSKGILRKTLTQKAEALLDMQIALEDTEGMEPGLSRSEAWNRLMRIEEDAAEEAEAWGMTLEEYQNRP